ncbi:hypothetical protein [Massilia glaciei]|uniref:hypothetical protein n=1 Tax=Massilia glaciei TaxID=1524097 RepID=UPI0011B209F9|nr:hypothetical protein [Massilia glaciei]
MDSNKIKINFDDGAVLLGGMLIGCKGFKISDLKNMDGLGAWKWYKQKKIVFARLDSHFQWEGWDLDSVILDFENRQLRKIFFPFRPTPNSSGSVSAHPISLKIEEELVNKKLIKEDNFEKKYTARFGEIAIQYDIRMLTISMLMLYDI